MASAKIISKMKPIEKGIKYNKRKHTIIYAQSEIEKGKKRFISMPGKTISHMEKVKKQSCIINKKIYNFFACTNMYNNILW